MPKLGSIAEARPYYTRFIKLIGRYFGDNLLSGRTFPLLSENDENLSCQIVAQARDNLKKNYPNLKFIFYVHPFNGISERLAKCLKEKNVSVHQGFVKEFVYGSQDHIVQGDGHPNAAANELIAQDILRLLTSYF